MNVVTAPLPRVPTSTSAPPVPVKVGPAFVPVDKVELAVSAPKAFGAVGAMAGALSGRALASAAVGAGGVLAGSMLGPWGAVVGGAVGLAAGIKLELKTRAGRLVGGLVGGALGTAAGTVAKAFGHQSSEALARETKGFSLAALPKRLMNTHYTSHPQVSGPLVADGVAHMKPGDVLITNDDGDFMLEILQKMTGCKANWTHNYLVDSDNTVMDILMTENKPTRHPLAYALTDNTHLKILRPDYKSPETLEKTLEVARSKFGHMTYDYKFDLKSDDAQYCQEYTYKAIKEGAPEIRIEPHKRLFRDLVSADEFENSPDLHEVWTTGSNFWLNWLSHFD